MTLVGALQAQVSVTATAADPGPTPYTTVSAAFAAINAGTHQGVITIVVAANTTEPAPATALLQSAAPSSYTSVLLTCAGDVTINSAATPTGSRGIIELLGADNVTIDGDDPLTPGTRNLTIQMATTTTTGTQCIRVASNSTTGLDGASNNTIRNCNIIGGRSNETSSTSSWGIIFSNGTSGTGGAYANLNTLIENNFITRCYTGIGAIGVSATYLNQGTIIRNNTIGSATSADNVGQRGITITYSASTAGPGSAVIENNDIRVGSYGTGYSSTIAGIEVGTVNAGLLITRNHIHDINQPSTGGYGAHGIYITGSASNAGITMTNNFIRDCRMVVYQTSKTSTFIPCGVFFTAGATLVNFDHNTISMGPQLGAGVNFSSFGMNASVSGVTFASFRNNIIRNTHVSTNAYGFNTAATTNISGGSVDNNDYYVPGGLVGYYNAANQTTLGDWQAATSKDAASISLDPPFVSATDLHIQTVPASAALPFFQTGAAGTGVLVDHDLDPRATPPCIGADEFVIPACASATAGSVSGANACVGSSNMLSLVGATSGLGVSYQWYYGPAGNPTANALGTGVTQNTSGIPAGNWEVVCTVTCANCGPCDDTTPAFAVTVNALPTLSIAPTPLPNVWQSGSLFFSNSGGVGTDVITPQTHLTRAASGVIYNSACQAPPGGPGCSYSGPCNTEWAIGTLANWNTLIYDELYNVNFCAPPSMVGQTMVCHLLAENIYFQVTWNSWGTVGSGGFSYTRTTGPLSLNYCVSNPAIALTASGATQYSWSPAAGLDVDNVAAVNASPSTTTTYTVTGTDGNGCQNTATSTITVLGANPTIVSTTATPGAICVGDNSQLQVDLAPPTGYCAASSVSTSFEKIAQVQLADINNPSTSTAGYEDFTAVVGNVVAGNLYPLTLNINNAYANNDLLYLWMDVDQNGVFDNPGELLWSDAVSNFCPACTNAPAVVTGNVTIPAGAVNGSTRIRFRLQDQASSPNNSTPCGNAQYGQVEDYTLNVTGGVSAVSYDWSPAAGLSNSTIANPVATPTSTTTYTVTVTTVSGCSSTGTTTVTVNPPVPITFDNCPANITVPNDLGQCTAVVSWPAVTSSGGCGSVTITSSHNSGDPFPAGTTTVTYTATDALYAPLVNYFEEDFSDNSAGWTLGTEWAIGPAAGSSCNSCPGNDPTVDHTPTADNGIAGMVIGGCITTTLHPYYYITSPIINLAAAPGTVMLEYWRHAHTDYPLFNNSHVQVFDGATWMTVWLKPADNNCINDLAWTLQSFDVTLYKNAAFQIRFGLSVESGGAYDGGGWNLDDVRVYSPASGTAPATCTFDVTVTDTEAPVIVGCVPDMIVGNDPGACSAVVSWANPTVTDNCSVTFTSVPPSGSTFPLGTTPVSITATDPSGNTATCNFTVTVNDTEAPQFVSAFEWTEDFSDNSAGWTLGAEWQIGPAAASACASSCPGDDPSADHTPTADNGLAGMVVGGCVSTAIHGYEYLSSPVINTAGSGGSLTLEFWRHLHADYPNFMNHQVQVFDGSAWVTVWQQPANSTCINDPAWTLETYNVAAYANANFRVRFGMNIGSGGAFSSGGWNIDDVRIFGSAPGLCALADIIVNVPLGQCDAAATWTPPLTADNCPGEVLTSTHAPGAVFPLGLTTVTYTITDAAGNTNACSFDVTVLDNDTDGDGTTDCNDGCPNDPNKIAPGICGCGVSDVDTDGDGTEDCNDGCPTDPLKTSPGICGCGVLDVDSDGDGTADCIDGCPSDPNKIVAGACGCGNPEPGAACDDGDPNTINDEVNPFCVCIGTPVGGPCTQNQVELTLTTDGKGFETSWDVVPAGGGAPLCSGSGYANNTTILGLCCLPNGCYDLRVFDSFGDGMCCAFGTGGYVLRDFLGRRIIDNSNDGSFGNLSQAPSFFCVPIGVDVVTQAFCDRDDLTASTVLQATPNTAVTSAYITNPSNSGYQFWFFNPDGGYSRRITQTHVTPGSSWPLGAPNNLKATYLRIGSITTNPVPSYVMLNIRIRALVSGVFYEFGPACRAKVDPVATCSTTQLTTTANPVISCGAANVSLSAGQASELHANEVVGANRYQFEFTAPGYLRRVASNTRTVSVAGLVTNPLLCGNTYDVRVRVSFDNGISWCPYGPICPITTAACPPAGEGRAVTDAVAQLQMYPNPNRGTELFLNLGRLPIEVELVTVDIHDLFGKAVMTRTYGASHGILNAVVELNGDLAAGTYLVTLTAGEQRFIERLVIQ